MRDEWQRRSGPGFTFHWEDEPDLACPYARQFERWTEDLSERLLEDGTVVSINQAKVLLLDQYQKWRDSVPKAHQSYTGDRHTCLFHIFDAFYKRLRMAELSLQPPLLFLPDPPTVDALARLEPPRLPEINGIVIGEGLVDDEHLEA